MATFEELTDDQRANLSRAAYKLFNNADVSAEAKRLLMKADKTVRFAEIEVDDRISAQLKDRDKEITELRNQQIQDAAERRREAQHARARERNLDPADVEKAIIDRGIGNWDTAMEFVELVQRAAAPTPSAVGNQRFEMPAGTDELWKDPRKWAQTQAHDAIDELRGRKRA